MYLFHQCAALCSLPHASLRAAELAPDHHAFRELPAWRVHLHAPAAVSSNANVAARSLSTFISNNSNYFFVSWTGFLETLASSIDDSLLVCAHTGSLACSTGSAVRTETLRFSNAGSNSRSTRELNCFKN